MQWLEYERAVFDFFAARFPSARVRHNVRLPGKLSATERQIDVLVEESIGGFPLSIVVDCKAHNRRIDVPEVGAFLDLLEDVGATRGVLVTTQGYSEAARARARSHQRCNVQVINFETLADFQDFWGMPYTGRHAAIINAPIGWIVDNKVPPEAKGMMLCSLYPQEFSKSEAFEKRLQGIYFNIFTGKPDHGFPGDQLQWVLGQHEAGVNHHDPGTPISYWEETNGRHHTVMRRIDYLHGRYIEFAGFNATSSQVSYAVLVTTSTTQDDDLAKLRSVMAELRALKLSEGAPANTHPVWQAVFDHLIERE